MGRTAAVRHGTRNQWRWENKRYFVRNANINPNTMREQRLERVACSDEGWGSTIDSDRVVDEPSSILLGGWGQKPQNISSKYRAWRMFTQLPGFVKVQLPAHDP